MANTLTAFFGLKEGSIMDDKSDEQGLPDDGQQSGGSCSSGGMEFGNFDDVDDSSEKLDAPDEMEKIEAPEEKINRLQGDSQDSNKPKLANTSPEKPKLANTSPEKPKLAERSKNTGSLPQFAKRKSTYRGGGSVIGGISSGGSVGAIAG